MKKKSDHSPDNAFLRELLIEKINSVLPGGKLPGLRKLMLESKAGRLRIEHLLQEFAVNGIIEIRPRSGCYRMAVGESPAIAFIHFGILPLSTLQTDFYGGIYCTLLEYARNSGTDLEVINASLIAPTELADLLKKRRFTRAFVSGAREIRELELIRKFVPYTVSLLPRHTESSGSELRDSAEMTAIQLDYLFKCNYRRIAFIHNAEADFVQSPVQSHRLLEYYRIMAENGLKIEPEWVFYCGYNWEHFNNCMYKLMKSPRQCEAVIVPGGGTLQNLYRFCRNNGISIGRELAVMSCDDTTGELNPRPTTVTNNPREIGERVWQIMQKTVAGECIKEYTVLRIVTGETVPHLSVENR